MEREPEISPWVLLLCETRGGLLPWCLPWWTRPDLCCAVPPAETVRDIEHQFHVRLEQERGQWAQYRESAEREIAELRRRLSEGQEEENLENEMKKVRGSVLAQGGPIRVRTQGLWSAMEAGCMQSVGLVPLTHGMAVWPPASCL